MFEKCCHGDESVMAAVTRKLTQNTMEVLTPKAVGRDLQGVRASSAHDAKLSTHTNVEMSKDDPVMI